MKKAKILIPAVAAVCLSTAATVAGTFAWFSATRIASISAANIAVVNPEGSLKCSATAGANTQLVGDNVAMNTDWQIRDASVKVAAGDTTPTVWKATNVDPSTGKSSTFATVDSPYYFNETKKICYAASWKLTFTMEGSSPDAYTVKFKVDDSKITGIKDSDAVYACFRIAMYTSTNLVVWAPRDGGSKLSYVSGSTTTGEYTKATGNAALGTLYATDSGKTTGTSLDVNCIAWFEGTSEAAVSSNLSVGMTLTGTSNLSFEAF